jgi:hypothetical protein
VASGTSRCPRGAEKQDADIPSEPTPKTCTRTDLTQINIKVEDSRGRRGYIPLVPGALSVADPPAEDVLRVSHHLRLVDLALCDSCRVGLPPVLKGWMARSWRGWMRRRQKLMGTAAPVSPPP